MLDTSAASEPVRSTSAAAAAELGLKLAPVALDLGRAVYDPLPTPPPTATKHPAVSSKRRLKDSPRTPIQQQRKQLEGLNLPVSIHRPSSRPDPEPLPFGAEAAAEQDARRLDEGASYSSPPLSPIRITSTLYDHPTNADEWLEFSFVNTLPRHVIPAAILQDYNNIPLPQSHVNVIYAAKCFRLMDAVLAMHYKEE